uniref:Uncharacterized protein n=1 Tax=Moniliophthora roreri TaxID=221103 RepID=A0A0W0FQ40_MONRR
MFSNDSVPPPGNCIKCWILKTKLRYRPANQLDTVLYDISVILPVPKDIESVSGTRVRGTFIRLRTSPIWFSRPLNLRVGNQNSPKFSLILKTSIRNADVDPQRSSSPGYGANS